MQMLTSVSTCHFLDLPKTTFFWQRNQCYQRVLNVDLFQDFVTCKHKISIQLSIYIMIIGKLWWFWCKKTYFYWSIWFCCVSVECCEVTVWPAVAQVYRLGLCQTGSPQNFLKFAILFTNKTWEKYFKRI